MIKTLALTCLLILLPQNADTRKAQSGTLPQVPVKGATFTLEELNSKINTIESAKELDEQTKTKVLEFYKQAINSLQKAEEYKGEISKYAELIKTAPEQINSIQEQEQRIETVFPSAKFINYMSFEQIELNYRQEQTRLAAVRSNLQDIENQIAKEEVRPAAVQKLKEEARKKLVQIEQELGMLPPADDKSILIEARHNALLLRQQMRQLEITAYEQELISHNVRLSLLTAQRSLAQRYFRHHEKLAKFWETEVAARQQKGALQDLKRAQDMLTQAVDLPEPLKNLARKNLKLAEENQQIALKSSEHKKQLERTKALFGEIKKSFGSARQRVEAVGLSKSIGQLLRKQRQLMPALGPHRKAINTLQAEISEIAIARIERDEEYLALPDYELEIINAVQNLQKLAPWNIHKEPLLIKADQLLKEYRELLDKLLTAYRTYVKNLEEHDALERNLVVMVVDHRDFIEKNILWIKSSSMLGLDDFKKSAVAVAWIARLGNWNEVADDLIKSLRESPGIWFLGVLVFTILYFLRRWAKRDLIRLADKSKKLHSGSLFVSLRIIGIIVALSITYPAVVSFIAWQVKSLVDLHEFSRALSIAILRTALLWGFLNFFYYLCYSKNIVSAHFSWPKEMLEAIYQQLIWFRVVAVLSAFGVSFIESLNIEEYRVTLGRLFFIICAIAFSFFFIRVYKLIFIKKRGHGLIFKLRYILFCLVIGGSFVLAVLTFWGYYYTALYLGERLLASTAFAASLLVFHVLLLRWLSVAHKRLVTEETSRKQQKGQVPQVDIETGPNPTYQNPTAKIMPEVQLAQISEQTRTILRVIIGFTLLLGLLFIWADVFPALHILGNIKLGWYYTAILDGVETQVPVTLADLAFAVFIITITVIATRNLPGFLQIVVLGHFEMEAGTRYAIITICRYTIMILGIIVAINSIGGSWSQIQWLVAALGVGLGFGLQEIFANFISGVIILFERPIRIGDTVTIGEITGTVSSIRIRATTITDWNRKELVVPNKEFITGKLINWSLSDPIHRVIIPVGIIYGSDTALAEELLLKAARENSLVLHDPLPAAVFLGFGDNSLNFELRVFISGITKYIPVIHQLHRAIDDEFRKHNIVIAFPQRDVHLDMAGPIKVELARRKKEHV